MARTTKPAKPHKDFPLFPHANGQWCKKVRGRLFYFGPWADPTAALKRWNRDKDCLLAGEEPPTTDGLPSVKDLCNRFLTAKESRLLTGELSQRSYDHYYRTCEILVKEFGKFRLLKNLGPADFQKLRAELAKTRAAVALGGYIQYVRSVFNFAYQNDLIDRPMKFGSDFVKPSRKTLRLEKIERGRGVFASEDIRAMLDAASPQMRAMIFLGINAGLGNSDCGNLSTAALDLDGGWLNYPRPKTGVDRRCPLWSETVAALKEAIESRVKPKDPANRRLVFLTRTGGSWSKEKADNPIAKETVKLLKRLGKDKPGWGFYRLRHTFRTVADECRDQPAINLIMGHSANDMPSNYRHGISDDRLRAVTNYVRRWLFPRVK